mgnify:CR=1 FL=1
MAFLIAFKATGDTFSLTGAIAASDTTVWGQLATSGWDYREKVLAYRNRQEEIDTAEIS